ncbi:acyl-CoA N-acyltransferase [Sporormia fimetaria CBS 119925]|uniref:Acyl-CoA N-acyltransferase n=1 Tax=Sporormia fimetaria CBS 119925 TaxID=1340428 RepID=A0A6A6V3M3_9PLEO|nr:acyl-CoA N-acyltransferase [Sporormia fimetaria CBS 119925]
MPIQVVPYNPTWPTHFQHISTRLSSLLTSTPHLSIEHIGSTSVPGLASKPIIDIDIIVSRPHLLPAIRALESAGFTYLGDLGIPDRHVLRDPEQEPVKRNVYVVIQGSVGFRNHLGLREVLRRDRGLREEYGRVKMELAGRVGSVDEYVEGKSGVLRKILKGAGVLREEELEGVEEVNRVAERIKPMRTERLVVREFGELDVEMYWKLESSVEQVRYQRYPPRTREEAGRYVVGVMRDSFKRPREVFEFVVECEGEFVGRAGALVVREGKEGGGDGVPEAHLFYSILPKWQGKGYATEAVRKVVDILPEPLRLVVECHPENERSVRMAERLGMERWRPVDGAEDSVFFRREIGEGGIGQS